MEFLEDAHERGILRRSGATYQFRHEQLPLLRSAREAGRPTVTARLPRAEGDHDVAGRRGEDWAVLVLANG